MDSFTYLDSIINKDFGNRDDVKSRIAKAQVFLTVEKKNWKNRKINM